MSLPHGAVGQSAVCDCDISWSYVLVERRRLLAVQIASNLYKYYEVNYCICYIKYMAIYASVIIYSIKRVNPLCKLFAQIRKGMGRQCRID